MKIITIMRFVVQCLTALLAISTTKAISTIHHDKPETVTLSTIKASSYSSKFSTLPTIISRNITLNPNERRKRLLPYENFYLKQNFNKPLSPQNSHSNNGYSSDSHHQQFKDLVEGRAKKKQHHRRPVDGLRQQSNGKFTPFLESNALPGPLRPMIPQPRPGVPVKVEYVELNPPSPLQTEREQENGPPADFSEIYDTLSRLKLRKEQKRPSYGYRFVQSHRYPEQTSQQQQKQEAYKSEDTATIHGSIAPSRTYIETFTATNIDISGPGPQKQYEFSQRYPQPQKGQLLKSGYRDERQKIHVSQEVAIEIPKSSYAIEYQPPRNLQHSKHRQGERKPHLVPQEKPQQEKSQVYFVRKLKPVSVIEENNFIAEKYVPYLPLKLNPQAYPVQGTNYDHSPVSNYQAKNIYEPRYPVTPRYRDEGPQKSHEIYQTIVQEHFQETPQKYIPQPDKTQPESYNVRDSYGVVTPQPQYEIVTSRPSQKYHEEQKYMVVQIQPESHRYEVVSPKPQLIEIISREPQQKYSVQQYHYQTVTPASVLSSARPEVQEPYHTIKDVQEVHGNAYHQNLNSNSGSSEDEKNIQNYESVKIVPNQYHQVEEPKYRIVELPKYEQVEEPKYVQTVSEEEEQPNSLAHILKQLQETNTLPQTLTPDNIDNSIKTLVRILDALKTRQKENKPVILQEEYHPDLENEAEIELEGPDSELDTPDGGTPGKPGIDYPALSSIPPTSFSCKTQRYKGFFGDPDTSCQVWHYCDLNGGQASFLCPNGTIFSQVALTCDWWFNVKCASTAQLYVLNERLYKYIIPLAPKFPEDYSGPLVDKYLALKFQEMEEKLKKEKKGKGNTEEDSDEDEVEEKTTPANDIESVEEVTTIQAEIVEK